MTVSKRVRTSIEENKKYLKKKITRKRPHKPLLVNLKKEHGRNRDGRITVRRGGGTKRLYRMVTFHRDREFLGVEGEVVGIEKDPNRTSFIALVKYVKKDGKEQHRYIIATENMKAGDKVIASNDLVEVSHGNATRMINIPVGTQIHNIEGKFVRSAGQSALILTNKNGKVILKMPSKKRLEFNAYGFASMGVVSNFQNSNLLMYKAGQSIYKSKRPSVRGVAMNPFDHPHGGGEGKTGTKRAPTNRTGRVLKGRKTSRSRRVRLV